MNVEMEHTAQLLDFLDRAKEEGKNWVAFNDLHDATLLPEQMHAFHSAADAEYFCSGHNYEAAQLSEHLPGYIGQPAYYHYMAIDSLRYAITGQSGKLPEVSMSEVSHLLQQQSLYLLPGGQYDRMEAVFQHGELFPVTWKKAVIPADEVVQYHVVQHEHTGGQVYEIGHRHRVLESFTDFEQARLYMEGGVNLSESMREKYDYLLVGQFRDKPLRLDVEGYPEPGCGLTFMTAIRQYNTESRTSEYVWHPVHSLHDPVSITQQLFAIYNPSDNRLKTYDGSLMETRPEENLASVYPSYFMYYDSITIKNSIKMNTENLKYLQENLKYTGFDTLLNAELEKNIGEKKPEFQLTHSAKIGQDMMEYALHFKQGDKNEMYFFNRMEATLKKPGENEQGVTQTFYQNQNITAKEAYNLLDGRAVHKTYHVYEKIGEGEQAQYKRTDETYNTWLQVNFDKKDKHNNFELNKYPERYGFDVERSLKEMPLKELDDYQTTERIVKSLKKGNLVEVTLNNKDVAEKIFLKANPQDRAINAYDANKNRLVKDDLKIDETKKRQQLNNTEEQAPEQKKKRGQKI